ncbi:hypothetical protein SAMN05421688_2421 [Poseidonocella pacifica]|uniref:Uncharacterized protein n=1 Tax=Poseidonocella pacifica TaxID=871651 RepID=A0A1I0XL60_9RHOB|nr:hypothetical protein [Poseidonocella pacifica]SFB01869.1 hypothetical protein SAMN05421688_2421 [Poseidonocella pacifica]
MMSDLHRPMADPASPAELPTPLDFETKVLLRGFLLPLIEDAESWEQLREALGERGYDIAFRMGHMVIVTQETGQPLCTGQCLGTPLKSLAARLGRPQIRLHQGGHSAEFDA